MENELKYIQDKLLNDEVVAFQTDTVYGLFSRVNLRNKQRLNLMKGRDKDQKIQISFSSFKQIYEWIDIDKEQKDILESLLPGNVSIIVPLNNDKKKLLNEESVLVRFPKLDKDNILSIVLEKVGPLFSTSANFHNREILSSCNQIVDNFKILCFEDENIIMTNKSSKIISLMNDKIKVLRK